MNPKINRDYEKIFKDLNKEVTKTFDFTEADRGDYPIQKGFGGVKGHFRTFDGLLANKGQNQE